MRTFATIGIGSLGSISFQQSISASAADRPHGVTAESWIRLHENLGIVITSWSAAANGYFMVKHGDVWQRLNIEPPRVPTNVSGEGPQT